MLLSLLGENLFDNLSEDPFEKSLFGGRNPLYGGHGRNLMKIDVKELPQAYKPVVDLPGLQEDEIYVDLSDHYLTISASKGMSKEEKDKDGQYIRQERYSGSCSRSFYVGDVRPEEVSARYENGILTFPLPKKNTKVLPNSSEISIQ